MRFVHLNSGCGITHETNENRPIRRLVRLTKDRPATIPAIRNSPMPQAPKQYRPNRPKAQRPEQHWKSRNTDYRGWYQSTPWKKLREAIITRDCGLCQECLRQGRDTPLNVHASGDKPRAHVDHIRPHRGDYRLFMDEANLQTLCETCHSAKTAREDGGFGRERK